MARSSSLIFAYLFLAQVSFIQVLPVAAFAQDAVPPRLPKYDEAPLIGEAGPPLIGEVLNSLQYWDFKLAQPDWIVTGTATNASITTQGLLFASTSTDPRLEGSAVDYPSSPSWQSFKVSFNMRVSPPTNPTGELYFGTSFTAANRATFTITSGTAFYTYSVYIPLQGAGSRLRLDPGDKVSSITVSWIRVEASDSYGAPQSLNTPAYNQVLQVSATVQETPPKITLQWPKSPDTQFITIYRKAKDDTLWGTAITTVAATATSYADNNVSPGQAYEYKLAQVSRYGYVYSGIRAPLVEDRGKIILLADATVVSSLTTELATLTQDLIGDGWQVIRHDVVRTSSVASIKDLLKSDYDADPANVKALYIFGHVPVPYSGLLNPDAHPDHYGAWPADCFYGEMTSAWTDATASNTAASRNANDNVPGDGKYDQTAIPSDLEMMVGRVDCNSMPAFKLNEIELLRQYLNKSHNYKSATVTAPARVMVRDNFAGMGEGFAQSGWRLSSQVGASNVEAGYWAGIISHLLRSDYLWGYGCGGGNYNGASGVANTTDFAANTYRAYFTILFGSYFGDWDNSNNFLRAPLCLPTYGLICCWAGRPNWYFHHMGLGETVGYAMQLCTKYSLYGYSYSAGYVHVALMGDPTLRMTYVAPAATVSAIRDDPSGSVTVTWSPSSDTVAGYYVYRSASSDGPFARISPVLVAGLSFVDAAPLEASSFYMVRAVRLETSASGTYYNAALGAFSGAPANMLQVGSTNPGGGIGIGVSVTDNNGARNGSTPFSRVYNDGVSVTLTAPAVVGHYVFQRWDRDGAPLGVALNATVAMTAFSSLTAVYAISTHTLTVASSNPDSGVDVTVSPSDNNGNGSGLTVMSRVYNYGATVTVTAPPLAANSVFGHWEKDGVPLAPGLAATVTVTTNTNLTAVYQTQACALTVVSTNPVSGVYIAANPADIFGTASSATQCALVYASGTTVLVTAPALAANGNSFAKWEKDGTDAGANRAISVLVNTDILLMAVYVPTTPTVTIAGTISGAPAGILVTATDIAGKAIAGAYTDAGGAYAILAPPGFSGWVAAEAPGFIFHPFRRAYRPVTASKTGQDFTAIAAVQNADDLAAEYKITYKKDGKGRDVSATEVGMAPDGGLTLRTPGAKDTLMLSRSAAVKAARRMPKAIRSISTTGGLGALIVEGDVARLEVGGALAKLTATNAIVCDVVTSGALGVVRMTARPDLDSSVDMIANISAAGSAFKKASVTISGAKLETLTAKDQDFTAITLATKLDRRTMKAQISGILGGAGDIPDVQVKSALSISASGASIKPYAIVGGIKKLMVTSTKLGFAVYPADLGVSWFHSTADDVTICANGGDILGDGFYVVDGRIAKFGSTYSSASGKGGAIGAATATEPGAILTSDSLGVVDVSPLVTGGAVVVVSGADPAKKRDIANVTAQRNLYGLFLAGASLSGVGEDSLPAQARITANQSGKLPGITLNRYFKDGYARVYADPNAKSAQQANVTPANLRSLMKVYYNDVEK